MAEGRNAFVHLHAHSHYSLMDGAASIDALIEAALAGGHGALALTDHGNLYGAVEFHDKARKKGLQPILGLEAYLAERSCQEKNDRPGNETTHFTLLAKDLEGWQNLLKLSSESFLRGFFRKPRIDKELLGRHSRGLIGLSGCLSGEINLHLLRGDRERARTAAGTYREILGPENFYLELMRIGLDRQETCNQELIRIGRELGIPLVATGDVHFLGPEDWVTQDVLLAISTGARLDDADRFRMECRGIYLRSGAEMERLFADVPDAVAASAAIAERCRVELPKGRYHLPVFRTGTDESPEDFFVRLCHEGLGERFGQPPPARALERLETEIRVILKMGFASYFLITWDFMRHARSIGVPVGPGRGSAAGSLVAYALRITDVDPLRYDLLFERFLNADRISMPDIDVDICRDGRQRIIEYVRARYGQESVCQIITFSTMGARRALRDVARVLDMPLPEVDAICKKLPEGAACPPLAQALEKDEELRALREKSDLHRKLFDYAQKIEGLARDPSTHAAGVVISDRPLTEIAPLCTPQGEIVTQWQMTQVERMGLLKMDFLGLKNLTLLDRAVRLVRDQRGIDLDLDRIPLDDPQTFALLSRADTSGIFQLESDGMRRLLLRLQPDKFEDIIALNALHRPGPMGAGMADSYVASKRGEKEVSYPHPDLEEILGDTYGTVVYQEQVMLISVRIAGFSMNDSDALRKAMSKKDERLMGEFADRFVQGAVRKGHAARFAEELFANLAKFAAYGFNKSHATAYALLAYRTAFMKAHYPLEFLCGLMSCDAGDSDKLHTFIQDAQGKGIEVLPPDVNRSQVGFGVEGEAIRFALSAVKGVGENAAASIVAARELMGGPFQDLVHLCEEVDLGACNRAALEALIKAGACDALAASRAEALAELEGAHRAGQQTQEDRRRGQGSLFGACEPGPGGNGSGGAAARRERQVWTEAEKLAHEKQALGFYLTGHPLQRKGPFFRKLAGLSVEELLAAPPESIAPDRVVGLAGMVSGLRVMPIKKGQHAGMKMARFTLDDLTGSLPAVVFARVWADVRDAVAADAVLFVQGRLQRKETLELLVDEVFSPGEMLARRVQSLVLHLEGALADDPARMRRLAAILARYPGERKVFLRVMGEDETTTLLAGSKFRVRVTDPLLDELAAIIGPGGMGFRIAPPGPAAKARPWRKRPREAGEAI